jgi:hypothetical protein
MVIRNRSRVTSLLALLSVVLLLATACSDDSGGEASTETTAAASDDGATTTTVADEEPPSESAAASLRSDLAGLLEEQVYLTGITVESAVAGGGVDSLTAATYEAEAGDGAEELANIVGGAYGVVAGDDFLAAWNDHRQAIVAVADGGPADAVATAREGILDALADMDAQAAFTDVADRLEASDEAMLTTVADLVALQPAAAVDLRTAAAEMPPVGLDLAEAIAGTIEVEGEVDSPESALRADLTSLLQESALLTGLGLAETVQAGGNAAAPGPAGVFAAVDENTQALAETIEPDTAAAAAEFATVWAGHIEDFAQYATALVNDDAEGIQAAQDALVVFRDDIGELLANRYPGFTKEQVAEELVDHTDSILAFADALVAERTDPTFADTDGVPESPSLLRTAALNMRLAARSLTGGLTAPASAATEEEEAG